VKNHKFITQDAFEYLRNESLKYDLVILDPPAFAKRKADIPNALRGYREINMTTLKKMPAGSLLLTCSCSYHVSEEDFEYMLFQAARDAKREVRIIAKHRQAVDHCMNIYHPESSEYLKSFLLYVS
jgi:23S rRNA (cytosine1962-C5)-methyltransferase